MSFAEGTDQPAPSPAPRTSGLFGTLEPSKLSLGTAIEVAFKALAKPAFVGPILVISVILNAILEVALAPLIARSISFTPGGQPTIEDLNALLSAAGVSFVVTLIGGTLVALYGQVWAVAASVGPLPTIGETLRLVGRRWVGVLGASLLVGAVTLGLVAIGVVVLATLAQISEAIAFGVAVGLVVALVWFVARLSMTPWLAADGVGVVESVRGSWRITEGSVLRIVGWSIGYGLLFALLAAAVGAALGSVPLIGGGIGQGLSLALTYAAGVTLYRRTQASAAPGAAESSTPPVTEGPVG